MSKLEYNRFFENMKKKKISFNNYKSNILLNIMIYIN